MIAGETMDLLGYNDSPYDEFFGKRKRRKRRKKKKRKRSKAERKARRQKTWGDIKSVIGAIGGFGQIGNTIDHLAGTTQVPTQTPEPTTVNPDSSIDIQVGDDITGLAEDNKKKSNAKIIMIAGVSVLVLVMVGAFYMRNKKMKAAMAATS